MSKLSPGLPGAIAGPRCPPQRSASRESTRSPERASSSPWHLPHRRFRSGLTFSENNRSPSVRCWGVNFEEEAKITRDARWAISVAPANKAKKTTITTIFFTERRLLARRFPAACQPDFNPINFSQLPIRLLARVKRKLCPERLRQRPSDGSCGLHSDK